MTVKVLSVGGEDVSALFPQLPERANKGSCGRVLCICGSYESNGSAMSGAAYFAASAAYKSGAGIVRIFTRSENYVPIASNLPEAVYSLYGGEEKQTDVISRLEYELAHVDSVVVGCGLGKSELSRKMVRTVLRSASCPLVVDADALNIIAEDDLWSLMSKEQAVRTVITPHMGEMSRLCGAKIEDILLSPAKYATELSLERGVVCLLKDHRTVISDGKTVYINQSGNAGMASAGMGDLLAGVIGAILSRKTVAEWADRERIGENELLYRAAVGAYVHGRAGDLASAKVGEYSLTSSDLLSDICNVIRAV